MTRERTKLLGPVLQAWAEGKAVQVRVIGLTRWEDRTEGDLDFENIRYEWRVKPEPRKIWINEYLDRDAGQGLSVSMVHLTREAALKIASGARVRTHEITLNDDEQ